MIFVKIVISPKHDVSCVLIPESSKLLECLNGSRSLSLDFLNYCLTYPAYYNYYMKPKLTNIVKIGISFLMNMIKIALVGNIMLCIKIVADVVLPINTTYWPCLDIITA